MSITFFSLNNTAPFSVRMHEHSSWELIYGLSGEGETVTPDASSPFVKGTIILQRPGVLHTKQSDENFSDLCCLIERMPIYSLEQGESPYFSFEDTAQQDFRQLMDIAYRYFRLSPRNNLLIDNLYDAMMQLVIMHLEAARVRRTPEVQWLQEELENRYPDPELDLGSLLQQIGYSADHLRRVFKTETGLTPNEYLRTLRINQAKRLIAAGSGMQIKEIAAAVGFYDPHYFNRVFKSETGLTPGEYLSQL